MCKGKVTERRDAHNDLCKCHSFLSQQLPWFALILPVAFVNNSPTPLKPWGWFAFSIADQAFLGTPAVGVTSGEHYSVWSLVWIGGGVEAEGDQRGVPCSQWIKRLKQCSRYSWDWRKGKEEDTNSHNKNWRYVTGLHLRPTRLFSFLDKNAAKSWDCQADRKLNVAFISPAFPFYSPASFALRFLLSEHPLHWALFCPPPKLPLLSKCGFSQDWVKSCAFFFPFCNYTSLLPFPNLDMWETTGGGSLEVLLVYRCPAKQ